jgi:hypothetical protein
MDFLQDISFIKKRNSNKHYFFNNIPLPNLTWEEVIGCLNFNVINNLQIITLSNFGIILHDYNNILIIDKILKYFSQLDPDKPTSAHLYISFTEKSNTFGKHSDTTDVLYWQGIGITKWVVEEDNNIHEYILTPNDLIYIPEGVYHDVTPLSPRVGVSFGLN